MNFPGPKDSVFWLDPAAGLTSDNKWVDSGPCSLHVSPVNFTSPNYGIATGPSGAKYIAFNGTTQRGTLPLRFYTTAPTAAFSVVCVARHNAPANLDQIFFAHNNAWTRGISLLITPTAERMQIRSFSAAGVASTWTDAASVPLTQRTRVSVLSLSPTGSVGYSWHDRTGVAGAFAGGTAAPGYDAAAVPTIGAWVGGAGNFFDGDLYFLALFPFVFTHAEAVAMSDWLRDKC